MIGALLAGASVVSGLLGSSSSRSAARAQQQAADAATAEQRRQFDITQQNQAPWLAAGQNALANLQNPNAFHADPGYQFARQQGTQGIERSAAARGGATSGNALKALAQFQTGLADQTYGNWWNRQAGLAGVGQTAANNLGAFGAQTANNIGQLQMAGGEARASGIMGQANSLGGALNSGLNNYLLYQGGAFGNFGGGGNARGAFAWNYPNGGFGGGLG